jgi:hypothetical protein
MYNERGKESGGRGKERGLSRDVFLILLSIETLIPLFFLIP